MLRASRGEGASRTREKVGKRKKNRLQKAVWDSDSLALLIKMSVNCIFFILRCVQGSDPEGDDVL